MTDYSAVPDQIQVGDTVAYKLRSGEPIPTAEGKVTALNTQHEKTLADIEWDRAGPPKQVDVLNLIKVMNMATV